MWRYIPDTQRSSCQLYLQISGCAQSSVYFVTVVIIAIILVFYASSIAPTILQLKKIDRIHHFNMTKVLVICLLWLSNRFERKPPRRGQPLCKGQMARPQCVLCLEVYYCWDHYGSINEFIGGFISIDQNLPRQCPGLPESGTTTGWVTVWKI